jgi:hypothetical protein
VRAEDSAAQRPDGVGLAARKGPINRPTKGGKRLLHSSSRLRVLCAQYGARGGRVLSLLGAADLTAACPGTNARFLKRPACVDLREALKAPPLNNQFAAAVPLKSDGKSGETGYLFFARVW